jgi:hypothetical protein
MKWFLLLFFTQSPGASCPDRMVEVEQNQPHPSSFVQCKSVPRNPFLFPTEAECEKAGKAAKFVFEYDGPTLSYSCEPSGVETPVAHGYPERAA